MAFENKFDYLEDTIEVRIESLKIEINNGVDKLVFDFEKWILRKKNRKKKKVFKLSEKTMLINKNIGIFYNEYDQSSFNINLLYDKNFQFKKPESLVIILKK